MLKSLCLGFLCVVSTVSCGPTPQQRANEHRQGEQNPHAVDNFNNGLVANPKIRENYMNCFLDHGPCSPEANNIKQMVPDALKEECAHCTELQRRVIEKMMVYLNNHQPEMLRQVAAKFDPNGEYMKQYIKAIERKESEQISNTQQQPYKHQQEQQSKPTVVTTAPIALVDRKP